MAWNWYLGGWILVICIGSVQFGYMMGEHTLIQYGLPCIYHYQNRDREAITNILNSAGPLGAFFGSIASGFMSYWGRRKGLLIANIFVIAAVGIRMAQHFMAAFFARWIFGFAVGIYSVIAPLFVIEVSPVHLKGAYGVFVQLGITFGILCAYMTGFTAPRFKPGVQDIENTDYGAKFDEAHTYWRLYLGIPAIFSIIQILFLLFKYKKESPKYYLIKEQYDEARSGLADIHGESVSYRNTGSFTSHAEDVLFELMEGLDPNPDGRTISSLRKAKYKRAFFVGVVLCLIQQLSGVNMIIFHVNTLVAHFKQGHNEKEIFSLVVGTINFLVTVLTIFSIRIFERKQLLLIGMLLLGFCNSLLFSVYHETTFMFEDKKHDVSLAVYQDILICLVVLMVVSYAATLGPISWLYLAEIMTEIGMGIAVSINWAIVLGISFFPKFARPLHPKDHTNNEGLREISWFFFFFGGGGMVAFFIISLMLKETKGLNPKQILNLYKEKGYNPLLDQTESNSQQVRLNSSLRHN